MADTSLLSLARLATPKLERLWLHLNALPGKVRVLEEHIADDEARVMLEPVLGQPAWLVCSLLEAVLSERGTFTASTGAPAEAAAPGAAPGAPTTTFVIERHYGTSSPELVWSGATGARSRVRLTRFVIEDLFTSVQRSVLFAGYSFTAARELFTPLFKRIDELLDRGEPKPKVQVVLDCSNENYGKFGDAPETIARRVGQAFMKTCWDYERVVPELLYYKPSTDRRERLHPPHSMHAKCIVVDEQVALVGSANFSTRGRDNRSLEVGALIRDFNFVKSLLAAWRDVGEHLAPIPS